MKNMHEFGLDLEKVKAAYLTGSHARNEEDEESEIDILIITDDFEVSDIPDNVQVSVYSLEDLKKEIKKDPSVASLIIDAIPLKPIGQDELKQLLNFTKEDITRAILRNAEEILNLLKFSGPKDSRFFLAMMYLRKIYILKCLLHDQKPSKIEFLESLKRHYLNAEEIYKLKRKIERGESIELKEEELEEFLKAVVDFCVEMFREMY